MAIEVPDAVILIQTEPHKRSPHDIQRLVVLPIWKHQTRKNARRGEASQHTTQKRRFPHLVIDLIEELPFERCQLCVVLEVGHLLDMAEHFSIVSEDVEKGRPVLLHIIYPKMSLITSISWVAKGFARADPVRLTGLPEEYKTALAEAMESEEVPTDIPEAEAVDMDVEGDESSVPFFSEPADAEGAEPLSDSEDEELKIGEQDALIAVGVQNSDFSEIHIYLYEEASSNLYVHHDFIVTSYPLDIEWLPLNPLDSEARGNCLAVASFEPFIEIWDLDLMNPIEPVSQLGGAKPSNRKKARRRQKLQKNSHTDAVLSINMHPNRNNLLASGSADCSVKIWDLFESNCKMTIHAFDEKV
jgi:hypothetical protein